MNLYGLHDFTAHEYILVGNKQNGRFLLNTVKFDDLLTWFEPVLYLLCTIELAKE